MFPPTQKLRCHDLTLTSQLQTTSRRPAPTPRCTLVPGLTLTGWRRLRNSLDNLNEIT
jgi:hypothetical protein